jgi:hypothetical protein
MGNALHPNAAVRSVALDGHYNTNLLSTVCYFTRCTDLAADLRPSQLIPLPFSYASSRSA